MNPVRLAVLGDPVAHSLSPVIQQAAMEYAGIDGTYLRVEVDVEGMERAAQDIRNGRLDGANVTMPHKELAAHLADRLSPVAERCQGANTLWREDGRLMAHTTDSDGVRFAWRYAGLPDDAPVLILGAGGAAAAALAALEDHECYISARRPEATRALVDRFGGRATTIAWGEGLPGAVVVNATPLGMRGDRLPTAVLNRAAGLLEMAYGAGETPSAARIRSQGLPVAPGELMLVGQGVASFAVWTGVEVPPLVMLSALEAAVASSPPPGTR